MDLKFRINIPQEKKENQFSTKRKTQGIISNNYSKNNQKDNTDIRQFQNKTQKGRKSALNKYYTRGSAPKNQYRQYFVNAHNVFYQDRQTLTLLKKYEFFKKLLLIVWVVLAGSLIVISRIQQYKGQCPTNANCGVYIHCNLGYVLNQQNKCVFDHQIINRAQKICELAIEQLKYKYGDLQCLEKQQYNDPYYIQIQQVPTFKISQLLTNIRSQLPEYQEFQQLQQKILSFLMNPSKQQEYKYSIKNNHIIPQQKKYSLICSIQLHIHSGNFKVEVIGIIIILIISITIYSKIVRSNKIKNIYKELKQKLFQEKIINISYAKDDLQKKYGQIDQSMWESIDLLRTNQRKIGFYQEDFLYWKIL